MALIGTLRNKAGSVIVGLITLAIVGFLAMDITNSQSGIFSGGGSGNAMGEVNGEPITATDFEKRYEEAVKNSQDRMAQQGMQLSENDRNTLRTATWDEMVNEKVNAAIYDKLGLGISTEEMADLCAGDNPHPYIVQSFTNPQTGGFDPKMVSEFLKIKDKPDPNVEPGLRARIWDNLKKEIKKDQQQKKYSNLVTKGLYSPNWLSELSYETENRFVNFKYVAVPLSNIADDQVKVTDDELKAFLKENAARYKTEEETRKIQYVSYPITPSYTDSVNVANYLNEKIGEFKSSENRSADSIFARIYSEDAFDEAFYSSSNLNTNFRDSLTRLGIGQTFGPYAEAGKFKIAKLTDKKMISDSVRVSEIVFNFSGVKSQEEMNAKVSFIRDTIFKALDSLNQNFEQMAAMVSEDPISKAKGGDIGWVKRGEKDKFYENIIFNTGKKGRPYMVSDNQSLRIIKIAEDRPSQMGYLYTYFTKSILPSSETTKNIYSEASKFIADHQTEAKFKEAAKTMNVQVGENLNKNAYNLNNLSNAREIIKWAFTSEKGAVSPIFSTDNQYIVAMLESIVEEGTPSVDAIKERLTRDYTRIKKGEMLAKKIADLKAASLEDLAAKMTTTVNQAEKLNMRNPMLPSGAYEPNAVAAAFSTPAGKISAPIKGNANVIVVSPISVENPPKANDVSMYAAQNANRVQSSFRNLITKVLKKSVKIEDNRFKQEVASR